MTGMQTDAKGIVNALTVDVEEHFQVSAFAGVIRREDWESIPSRVDANVDRLLALFDDRGVKGTFFVLGWVAERRPALVRRIADHGHEIAAHGYSHRLVYDQEPSEFRDETLLSRRILQEASGQPVAGYRAASFSIGRRSLWALDTLAEAGFSYDSSVFPVVHDRYGMPGAPRRIHRLATPGGATLVEVPPTTLGCGKATLPIGGGGYLRIYPAMFTRWAIARLNRHERMPAVVYVHPWEVDPDQPRVAAPLKSRFRHYWGLGTTMGKLRDLLTRYRFGPVRQVLEEWERGCLAAPDHRRGG
jgi:polysaccharide deacetylase family protein (PEP-CTERM system associated)